MTQAWEALGSGTVPRESRWLTGGTKLRRCQSRCPSIFLARPEYPLATNQSGAGVIWVSITRLAVLFDWQTLSGVSESLAGHANLNKCKKTFGISFVQTKNSFWKREGKKKKSGRVETTFFFLHFQSRTHCRTGLFTQEKMNQSHVLVIIFKINK